MSDANDVKPLYMQEFVFGPPLIGALLRIPWTSLRSKQLEALRARGFDDIHEAYLAVFQWPGPQGLRPSELAAQTRMSRQAVNHLLGQLETVGYLRRAPDPAHPRATRIVLTDRGRALGTALREIVIETEREWAQAIGEDRLEHLRELLTQLCVAVVPELAGTAAAI
jgi:DNA-binding MarR family transcriptional regulator